MKRFSALSALSTLSLPPLTLSITMSAVLLTTLTACQKETDTNQNASHNTRHNHATDTNSNTNANQENTSNSGTNTNHMIKMDFPQLIKDVPYLLHPIVPTVAEENRNIMKSIKGKGGYEGIDFFYQVNPYSYRTNMNNLLFEDIKTGAKMPLLKHHNYMIKNIFYPYITEKRIVTHKQTGQIKHMDVNNQDLSQGNDQDSIEILEKTLQEMTEETTLEITQETAKDTLKDFEITITPKQMLKHFIYQINEQPNAEPENKKTNLHKQLALYMSDENGQKMIKLHPSNQYLNDSKWMPTLKRYYFITQSDSDGNGIIDSKDRYHNYVIDFSKPTPVAESYSF